MKSSGVWHRVDWKIGHRRFGEVRCLGGRDCPRTIHRNASNYQP